MRSNTNNKSINHQTPAEQMGLGTKKTILVLCTVVGCIAILTPKIFYPMVMGPSAPKDPNRGPTNLYKQERPSHLRDALHPSMLERGKAIHHPHSVPIIERPGRGLPPGNIERRAGAPLIQGQPGPNMRAAAYQSQQQSKQTAGQNSIIMPIYTFGIVAFFVFTIVKIVMKKTKPIDKPLESDPNFCEKVFKQTQQDPKKKLVYTAIQGIIDATNEQLKEIEKDCAENNIEHTSSKIADEHMKETDLVEKQQNDPEPEKMDVTVLKENEGISNEEKPKSEQELELEKRLSHLRESLHIKSVKNVENSDLKSIYLDGELPHDPQILVSATETETKTEKISDYPSSDGKDVDDDEAIILSAKCTISLISLNNHDDEKNALLVEDHTTTTNNVA